RRCMARSIEPQDKRWSPGKVKPKPCFVDAELWKAMCRIALDMRVTRADRGKARQVMFVRNALLGRDEPPVVRTIAFVARESQQHPPAIRQFQARSKVRIGFRRQPAV